MGQGHWCSESFGNIVILEDSYKLLAARKVGCRTKKEIRKLLL